MEPTEEPKATSAARLPAKRWSRAWWLGLGGAGIVSTGGLVYAALHSAAEKVGEKGVETLFGASADDNLPHRKIAGDWCVVQKDDGGVRMLMECGVDSATCATNAGSYGHMFIGKFDCLAVPPSTPLWCTIKETSDQLAIAHTDRQFADPITWCYFENDGCKQQGELCFPTTKAALAR
jgi:hypothetical protein